MTCKEPRETFTHVDLPEGIDFSHLKLMKPYMIPKGSGGYTVFGSIGPHLVWTGVGDLGECDQFFFLELPTHIIRTFPELLFSMDDRMIDHIDTLPFKVIGATKEVLGYIGIGNSIEVADSEVDFTGYKDWFVEVAEDNE